MLGLLIKDYILIKNNITPIYLFSFIAVILPIIQNSSLMLPVISLTISLLFAMQVLQTISFDERTNWNRFVVAMPISVKEVILSKYILSLTLAIISSIVVAVIDSVLILIFRIGNSNLLPYIILSFACGSIYNSFIIPIAKKFGSYNCKYIMMIFVTLPTFIVFVLRHFNIEVQIMGINNTLFLLMLVMISLFISTISYYISIKIRNFENNK